MPNQSPDPFTLVARAILAALQGDGGWAALVKPANVIDMTAASFERFKTRLQPADVPEVILLQEEFLLRPFGPSSRLAEMEQAFSLVVTHDSLRVCPVNVLKYQTLVALSKAGASLGLDGLVRSWEITQGNDDATSQKPWKRGTQRWLSILSIRTSLFVTREKLTSLS
jgi:hypothetical protein